MAQAVYAFGNAQENQRERLEALEAVLDQGTIRHLEALEVQPGWRCLEIGAGGGSIADWLCDRVGRDGRVVATDLDTTVLQARARANLDIRVHDVRVDPLPEAAFDLAHMRLVLAWMADPAAVLDHVLRSLKPGGLLLVEEMDFLSAVVVDAPSRADAGLFQRVIEAHLDALVSLSGFDRSFGRRLVGLMERARVAGVRGEARAFLWRAEADGLRLWQLTFAQLRDAMIAGGTPPEDVDRAMALCGDPGMSAVSPLVMAAWGRAGAHGG